MDSCLDWWKPSGTGDMTKDEFVPIRLGTGQYNALKVDIHAMKLDVGYGDKTIIQSMNAYLKSSDIYIK